MNFKNRLIARLGKEDTAYYYPKDRYLENLTRFLVEDLTSEFHEGWILSKSETLGSNFLILKKHGEFIYLCDIVDKCLVNNFHAKRSFFIQLIYAWRKAIQNEPAEIDVLYNGSEINFKIREKSSNFVTQLVRDENRAYRISERYVTIMGCFLQDLTYNSISIIKKNMIKGGTYQDEQTNTFIESQSDEESFVIIKYKNVLFHYFGIAFEKPTFIQMLDDWQQILEDKPHQVDVFYDGKTVWFETK